MNIVSNFFFMI